MRAEEAAEQGRLRFVAVLGGANASGMKLRRHGSRSWTTSCGRWGRAGRRS